MHSLEWRRKAKDLKQGDVFRLHVYCEVTDVAVVDGGKHVRVRIGLEDQGRRHNCGALTPGDKRNVGLSFLGAAGLEFVCRSSRVFLLHEWDEDDDRDCGEHEPDPVNPSQAEPVA